MPNIWTHILFADQLCQKTGRTDILESSSFPLHIGAQGPDPFFYHHFWPFLSSQEGEELGYRLHTEKCGSFLMDMVVHAATEKNPIQAFVLGFLSHHILDRNTHPFIHYHAGYEGNKHQVLEVIIDTMMLDQVRNEKTYKNPAHKKIDPTRYIGPITSWMTLHIVHHFPEVEESKVRKLVRRSYKDIFHAQRVLYDPYQWKNKYFGSLVSSFSHQPIKEYKDYLNESHSTWHHSATNEPDTQSFTDLYDQAVEEGAELFQAALDYWEIPDLEKQKQVKQLLGDVSYDTGLPLSTGLKNQYSSPIV
ncbi:hypothetical protein EQV77_11405 [Halobacillus fulvus]|nr:hypothetical protein EQV77_11405 [Halobacillus fulvus]